MAQSSGPKTVGSAAERQFTDVLWADLFGDESAIVQDFDGSSYNLSLSSTSDIARVGSATQDSVSMVGGFNHTIPQSRQEELTIAPATSGSQTTIIAVRYDPSYTDGVLPCRLVTFSSAGTSDGLPPRSSLPTGVVIMPLWSVTRRPSQVLSQANVQSLRRWAGPTMYVDTVLPNEAPLGTVAVIAGAAPWQRQFISSAPAWRSVAPDPIAVPTVRRPGTNGIAAPKLGTSIFDTDIQQELLWNGVQWIPPVPPTVIPPVTLPPTVVIPLTKVWVFNWPEPNPANPSFNSATNAVDLTIVSVPDPGWPYRVGCYIQAEVGTKSTGTRWDLYAEGQSSAVNGGIRWLIGFSVGLGGVGTETITPQNTVSVPLSGPIVRGAISSIIISARRAYGVSDGKINVPGRSIVVYLVPA